GTTDLVMRWIEAGLTDAQQKNAQEEERRLKEILEELDEKKLAGDVERASEIPREAGILVNVGWQMGLIIANHLFFGTGERSGFKKTAAASDRSSPDQAPQQNKPEDSPKDAQDTAKNGKSAPVSAVQQQPAPPGSQNAS